MAKNTDTCAVVGCQRQATHICYLARHMGLIKHPYVCEAHLAELPCSYLKVYEKKEVVHAGGTPREDN